MARQQARAERRRAAGHHRGLRRRGGQLLAMRGAMPHDPAVVSLWTWMAVGDLSIGVDLQFDQLSILMMLVVTGCRR